MSSPRKRTQLDPAPSAAHQDARRLLMLTQTLLAQSSEAARTGATVLEAPASAGAAAAEVLEVTAASASVGVPPDDDASTKSCWAQRASEWAAPWNRTNSTAQTIHGEMWENGCFGI